MYTRKRFVWPVLLIVVLAGLTGFDGQPPAGAVEVRQHDMGTGDSQVLLAQFAVAPGAAGPRPIAEIDLRYNDLIAGRPASVTQPIYANAGRTEGYDPLWDVEVLRNVTIQNMAQGLKEISRLYQAGRYQEAWNLAYGLEQDLRAVAALTGEEQMVKDADLMHKYQATLAPRIESETGAAPASGPGALPTRFYRGRQPDVTPTVPVLEVK